MTADYSYFSDGPINVLLVEDNPGDVRLTKEGLKDGKLLINLHVVQDGTEAMAFLYRQGEYADSPRPDLILLDLNLPQKDGREVLAEVKEDENLKRIPVVVLTSSEGNDDVLQCYLHHANCYIQKPVDMKQFTTVVKSIENFWFAIVKLPED